MAPAYPDGELHLVLDNLSTHKTPAVQRWLKRHPRVSFAFTPTSASWMNQVGSLLPARCPPVAPL